MPPYRELNIFGNGIMAGLFGSLAVVFAVEGDWLNVFVTTFWCGFMCWDALYLIFKKGK